jgi:hypothetical protein
MRFVDIGLFGLSLLLLPLLGGNWGHSASAFSPAPEFELVTLTGEVACNAHLEGPTGAAGLLGALVQCVPEGIAKDCEFLSLGQAVTAARCIDRICRSPVECRDVCRSLSKAVCVSDRL